jgi:ferredoxin-like protein FixX
MYSEDIITTQANIGFMDDDKFKIAYQKCLEADKGRLLPNNYSIRWRIHTLLWASKYASSLEGDFVDFGGGFGLFASAIYEYLDFDNENKKYYLLDSFEGLDLKTSSQIESDRNSNYTKFGSWEVEVLEKFKNYKNVNIIKGFIPESLEQLSTNKICFASIDLNSTLPEKSALEFTWDRLVKGGIIIFDDYGFPGHIDQKNSHDKFAKENNSLIYTCPTGQGILIK